ncbi:hypothetical protein, partial [Rhodanobacter lindaniclasticus]
MRAIQAVTRQPRHRQGQAVALGVRVQAQQGVQQMVEHGQPSRPLGRGLGAVPPCRLQRGQRAMQRRRCLQLGRIVGCRALLQLRHRRQYRRQPQLGGDRVAAFVVEQHLRQRMAPATGRRTGQLLRPPTEL